MLHMRMGADYCQSRIRSGGHSSTVQEHDEFSFRYVTKAKTTDMDSVENCPQPINKL